MRALLLVCLPGVWLIGGAACADPAHDAADAGPDARPPVDAPMPQSLRETGLYADFDDKVLAPAVRAYQPAFELWSDGADKARWVLLPEGTVIDSADMDFWAYPEGTRFWKEFSRDGVRLETRLLHKTGPGIHDWHMMPYVWNEAQTDALAAPDGAQDVLDTSHDVPEIGDCEKCHQRVPDVVIGFSAILLDHELGGLTLAALVRDGLLTQPPDRATQPFFPLPGDDTATAALGYLHVNCGNCHHPRSDVMDTTLLDLRLVVDELAEVEGTPAYTSAAGVPPDRGTPPEITALIEPGLPLASAVHARMATREGARMPPIGSELIDEQGLAAVAAWIQSLAPLAATTPAP